MVPKSIVVLVIISFFHTSLCWIFNDIRTKAIQDNVLDADLEDLTPEELARLRFSLIYPGTKWCGPGNVAENYDDLGPSRAADACCRDHDNCPEYITAGDTKHNLTNPSYFTRWTSNQISTREADDIIAHESDVELSCNCDETFRRCLLNADTKTSNTIGYMYFNVIGTQCYKKDYLITGCKQEGGWLDTKCVEYSYDTSSEKTYQWFDVPNFSSARLLARTRLNSRR